MSKAQLGNGAQFFGTLIADLFFTIAEQVIGDANKQILEGVAKAFSASVVGVFSGGLFVAFGKPLFATAVCGSDF